MADQKSPRKSDRPQLTAAEFRPLESTGVRRKLPVSPAHAMFGLLLLAGAVVLVFLFAARAVIFRTVPEAAEIDVGGLSFNIGSNYLLLPGSHRVEARAEGYHLLEQEIAVTRGKSQEIELVLEPLPGRLEISAALEDIAVTVDGEPAGTAPGVIEEISKGVHILEFTKHRYFPNKQEIEIEGLGKSQQLAIEMVPAWGQLQFSSVPEGAELLIDGEPVGQTPMSAEVLETGTTVSLQKRGYKTWEKQVSVKAGSVEAYPEIVMIVADGRLRISSSPASASVTIDQEFRGTTPVTVPLSPLREHEVELFREGYRRAVRRVSVEPEKDAALNVSLTPIIGTIRLAVEPADAEVVVDGQVRGIGSQVLELNAREHNISVRRAGYDTQSVAVTPRPEHEQSLQIKLLTVEQAYWSTRPPKIGTPVGSSMLLFRPNATFSLGAPRREPGRRANEAQRNVRLVRPFYIGTHEVTNEQFRTWKEEHSSRAMRAQTLDMDDQPAVFVSWQEAALFCNWLSRREGLPLFYIESQGEVTGINADSHGYRLPTEAEWAWVARIDADGKSMMFPWGTDVYPPPSVVENYADQSAVRLLSFTLANYNDGFITSAPVGSFEPNSKGLYDLSGNVSEWVSDYYDISPSRGEPEEDPLGPVSGNRHVIRGANWSKGSRSELRLSYRDAGADGRMDTGFRLARYVDKPGADR